MIRLKCTTYLYTAIVTFLNNRSTYILLRNTITQRLEKPQHYKLFPQRLLYSNVWWNTII